MILNHLTLSNFRSYTRLDLDFQPGITILSGGNAQGKTSLLESLFYCATFSPLLAKNDSQLINFEALNESLAVARIVASFTRENRNDQIEIRIIQEPTANGCRTRKEILLNTQKISAQKAVGSFPAVLFIPQMTSILEGPPQERRRYLNILLSQSFPGYAQTLTDYQKVLLQRNALLKQIAERRADPAQLDYWDEMLAEKGAALIADRAQALITLNNHADEIHLQLTDQLERIKMNYLPSFDPNHNEKEEGNFPAPAELPEPSEIAAAFKQHLHSIRQREIERGVTTSGPHRDDFQICANDIDLGAFGSRGQIRTALLTLKFAEIDLIKEKTGTDPLLLLDETLAELDERRRLDLLNRLNQTAQGILTTTDLTHFSDKFTQKHRVLNVSQGVLSAR